MANKYFFYVNFGSFVGGIMVKMKLKIGLKIEYLSIIYSLSCPGTVDFKRSPNCAQLTPSVEMERYTENSKEI